LHHLYTQKTHRKRTIEETNLADLPPKKENMGLQTELQIKQTEDRVA